MSFHCHVLSLFPTRSKLQKRNQKNSPTGVEPTHRLFSLYIYYFCTMLDFTVCMRWGRSIIYTPNIHHDETDVAPGGFGTPLRDLGGNTGLSLVEDRRTASGWQQNRVNLRSRRSPGSDPLIHQYGICVALMPSTLSFWSVGQRGLF